MRQWGSVYLYDNENSDGNSEYVDLTFAAQDFPGSEPDYLMAQKSDQLYFGLDRTFTVYSWIFPVEITIMTRFLSIGTITVQDGTDYPFKTIITSGMQGSTFCGTP